MNKFLKFSLFLFCAAFVIGCNKDDDNNAEPLRDYAEQYIVDLDTIDEFIDTHYMTVNDNMDVTFAALPTDGSQLSIRNQTTYPLQFKMVNSNNVDYKVYYIKFREGVDESPTKVDSVHVSYKGNLISLSQFDTAQTPIWFSLDNLIRGWGEIIPLFKTGLYDESEGPNPVTFTDFGAGVMFLPSGLGYYGQPATGVPSYSSLIFSFKLYELQYRDHDRDGILSKDEVATPGDDPTDFDTDEDGSANMFDIDDDGDNVMTKNEVGEDSEGNAVYLFCPGSTIPKHLDGVDCQ